MSKQPEALRLADVFEKEGYAVFTNDMQKAAAELRRLHAINAELVEALKLTYSELSSQWSPYIRANEKAVAAMKSAREALAKAEGREA